MLPHCHEIIFNNESHTLALTLFLGGLVGSISHCAGMCGPFVLAQVSYFDAPGNHTTQTWLRSLLFPYHLGRLTTYTLLGIIATWIASPLLKNPSFSMLSSFLLMVAGILFLASAFSQIFPARFFNFSLCGVPGWIMKFMNSLLPSHSSLWSGYVLGVLLGFLPCGLVYAAVAAAMATGNAAESAVAMMAFAGGTMPTLMAISLSGKTLLDKKHIWVKPVMAALMIVNGIVLFMMAGKGFI